MTDEGAILKSHSNVPIQKPQLRLSHVQLNTQCFHKKIQFSDCVLSGSG